MAIQEVDQAKLDAFGGQMLGMLNSAALALMTSIGYQVGLFETMAGLPPASSDEVAAAAGLNERYVREWLGAMVVGNIVAYDPATGRYSLPPEHAAWLVRTAGLRNMGTRLQMIPMLAAVEKPIIECFRSGGGVPYSAYTDFQRLMAESSATRFDTLLIQQLLPSMPGLVNALQSGIDVADVGCGSGHAVNLMAQAFPDSRFTGYDFSESGITAAELEAARLQLTNARFQVQDVARLTMTEAYDLVTAFDAIHDQAQPRTVLRNIAAALRPSGAFLMVDIQASSDLAENISHPLGPFVYTVSTMHCMTVSLALNGEGLGTAWGEQRARELLAEAGFTRIEVLQLPGDIMNNYYIASRTS